ncbi:PilT/PilU family type 4a pilus ATPase [Ferrimonas aestuarii]|uniref:PilT/PilU family type 4a pilus ATPase n=1 Tax=Ferrimonas aestuarii TaxID=2569539 RepID=A0A4U1BI20_9GAMM|nr:PilT/PilU family type 4a pilus ATPase [Ferrimonas aestuarii]TKB50172.1 PilT/PilU family type 4a pilus ATPase [Ferrimonas aestuarii]
MDITGLLKQMVAAGGSDLFITCDFPVSAKIDGVLSPLSESSLTLIEVEALLKAVMSDEVWQEFCDHQEANFAYELDDGSRFRVSAFWQRKLPGMVLRRIQTEIPTPEELKLPKVMTDVAMAKRGLVLMVGATGTGKSTSLAAMVGHRNANQAGHILTIEDPIEFVHKHRRSIVTQREVGQDTESFESALKSALRQAPDVILIGEIRTPEAMAFALAFAETGHLCMATLHASNANQALDRILHLMPEQQHRQLLFDLSLNLNAIIAQQLVPSKSGEGREAAIEVLLNTPRVSGLLADGKLHELKATMAASNEQGMCTFDQALYELFTADRISEQEALHHADSANDLRLMIKLKNSSSVTTGSLDKVTLSLD